MPCVSVIFLKVQFSIYCCNKLSFFLLHSVFMLSCFVLFNFVTVVYMVQSFYIVLKIKKVLHYLSLIIYFCHHLLSPAAKEKCVLPVCGMSQGISSLHQKRLSARSLFQGSDIFQPQKVLPKQ